MTSRIRVGLQYETYDPIETQRDVWRLADETGFDQIWNSDHLTRTASSGNVAGPILDSWTALAAMAEATQTIRVGVLVTGNLYRNPSLLAKMATTVDHVSGGRLEVGLGTAWNEAEFTTLGLPFADVPERARRLDEACVVLKKLWTEERASFDGRYYKLKEAIHEPKPVQKPHPPIVIGGRGPKMTLRAAARHGAAWNTSGGRGFDADAEAAKILDEHCARIGRDPKSIRRSVIVAWPDAAQGLALARRYFAIGFTEFLMTVNEPDSKAQVLRLSNEALVPLRGLA
ncbi:MAG: TIGR03560 family F420-dependent LLM class oxidoreductase [Candidatus Limnocylindria bacterium]